jgi:hypothetical protein
MKTKIKQEIWIKFFEEVQKEERQKRKGGKNLEKT